MTSRVRVLCALLAALSLVATACPGGSDTDTTEFTGDEPPGDTLAAEAPGPATPDGVAPETAAVGRVEAEGTDPAAAPEPAADPAADAPVAYTPLAGPTERMCRYGWSPYN
ncbi:MAG: hypothetical protein F4232_00195 [Acidimicrobiaceae bacterium]|nr:hypothetical protein [Acidimicrobiaceae bacterium]